MTLFDTHSVSGHLAVLFL